MPEYLFDHIALIKRMIVKGDRILVFLDYDGTLVPFCSKPDEVQTPKNVLAVLQRLVRNPDMFVAIVSGRGLNDLKKRLRLRGAFFLALHGLIMESPDGSCHEWERAEQARPVLTRIKRAMLPFLRDEQGAFLEDKKLTLVLHYRLLHEGRASGLRKVFRQVVRDNDTGGVLEVMRGAKVLEARPKGWDKGKAIGSFLAGHSTGEKMLPVYIGDDVTDEDAFRYLGKRGITVHVRNGSTRRTCARFWVKDPEEVLVFLRSLSLGKF